MKTAPNSLLNLLPRRLADSANRMIGWRKKNQDDVPFYGHQFTERVAQWHACLASLPGQHFALYMEDGMEFSATLFGAWYAGKTIWLAPDTLAATHDALKRKVDGFLGEFSDPVISACLRQESSEVLARMTEPLDAELIGLVVFTSGTTGDPVAIPKKLSQLAAEISTLEQLFGEQCADAEIFSTVTHQHIYGLLFKLLWPLVAGRPIHARTQLFHEELAERIATRSGVLISSPAYLKRLPTHFKNNRLRAVFSSGGVLPQEVAKSSLQLLGQMPIEIYGSSETGGVAWRQRGLWADDSWRAMPNVQWHISEAEQRIEVRSPHLFSDEWCTLSDHGQAQQSGGFILKGRCDRIVKIEEKRISLDLIEQQLAHSPFVAEVKIVVFDQVPEHQRHYLAAVIVLSETGKSILLNAGKLALNRQLRDGLMQAIEPLAQPRRWRYVERFPVNQQGKTTQVMLRELFERKLISPVVTLLDRDAGEVRDEMHDEVQLQVMWPSNLLYFEGHFPGAPILPGVVQIDWAIKIARQFFALPAQFQAMHALKFQHVILPDSWVQLKLNYSQQKTCLQFSYFAADKSFSSGRILFTEDDVAISC